MFSGQIEIACTEGSTIRIGKNCLFSALIDIRNGDSHAIFNSNGDRSNRAESISIGDHVWVARRAMILKGTEILDDSVIGAGAIVANKFDESNVVIAGVPAKVVKENITWEHERNI